MRKIFGDIAGYGLYASLVAILVYGFSLAITKGESAGGFLAWFTGSIVFVTVVSGFIYMFAKKKQ